MPLHSGHGPLPRSAATHCLRFAAMVSRSGEKKSKKKAVEEEKQEKGSGRRRRRKQHSYHLHFIFFYFLFSRATVYSVILVAFSTGITILYESRSVSIYSDFVHSLLTMLEFTMGQVRIWIRKLAILK